MHLCMAFCCDLFCVIVALAVYYLGKSNIWFIVRRDVVAVLCFNNVNEDCCEIAVCIVNAALVKFLIEVKLVA